MSSLPPAASTTATAAPGPEGSQTKGSQTKGSQTKGSQTKGSAHDDSPAMAALGITVRFGGLMALADVSVTIDPGTIVGLVGPNGAGKSTLLSVLSGLRKPNEGRVWLRGEDVTAASARTRARLGLARTFQQPEVFMGLTVREHLVLAYRASAKPSSLWFDMLDPRSLLRPPRAESERVDGLLEALRLTQVAGSPVAALPLGVIRLVEVGRALASGPRVLLCDEPLSGLDIRASENLLSVFREIVEQSKGRLSLLMVEHDVAAVLSLSDKVVVLDFGEPIAEGTPEAVRNDPAVRSAYLGDSELQGRSAARSDPNGEGARQDVGAPTGSGPGPGSGSGSGSTAT